MPTSSFSASDANNEVVCPLRNQDGSNCRKRCLGEKRYRSMQEHIRRAHPNHYIPKLPATEESFQRMINSPPSERPLPASQPASFGGTLELTFEPDEPSTLTRLAYIHERDTQPPPRRSPVPPRTLEDQYPAAATAAVALAQLHNHRPDSDWESDADYASETDNRRPRMHPSIELPPIQKTINQQTLPSIHDSRPRELLPSMLAHSPPDRATTLPPIQGKEPWHRKDKQARPRKSSITQNNRKPKHEKSRSKDYSRRLSIEGRKAFSAEPQSAATAAAMDKRWNDLIEAATSATEADSDRDLTPVPQSPTSVKRASLPPFPSSVPRDNVSYKASPLARTLTPPPASSLTGPTPFPSIETSHHPPNNMSLTSSHSTQSSVTSGHNFHIPSSGLSMSNSSDPATSPTYYTQPPNSTSATVQIYCGNCRRLNGLKECYACTECISGFCSDCVYMLSSAHGGRGRSCPRCGVEGPRYKPFQLDLR